MTVNLEQLQITSYQEHQQPMGKDEAVSRYHDAMSTLMTDDVEVISGWEAASSLPEDHALWKLELLNAAYEATAPELSEDINHIAQAEVFRGAAVLASRKLPQAELHGLGLPPHLMNEASDVSSVSLKDVRILGRAWDNSGRDPVLLEICDRMISLLDDQRQQGDSKLRTEEYAILYKAAKTGISYRESVLQHLSVGNEIDVYSKIGQRLVRIYSET